MDKAEAHWLWKGRRVKVVDGTGLSMPDTPQNQKEYPQPEEIPAGVGFPLLRLVVVFCLSVGTVLDAAMGRWSGKGTGEVSLWRRIDDVLDPGDVLLGDRIYSTFWACCLIGKCYRAGRPVSRHSPRPGTATAPESPVASLPG